MNDVSVIVPAFNVASLLADAIATIRGQERVAEIIVVDDGSTDHTADLATGLADVVLRQEHRGVSAARNAGVAAASGSRIAFLDGDDLWTSGKVALQSPMLDRDPAVGVALGHTIFRSLNPTTLDWTDHERPQLLFSLGAALIRRELFESIGTFDETLACSEDVDWFLRARDAGVPIETHPEVVQYARRHGANTTFRRDLRELQFIEVLKRSLDRRRSVAGR